MDKVKNKNNPKNSLKELKTMLPISLLQSYSVF